MCMHRRFRSLWVAYQDFEYILSGYMKLFQSQTGSALSAHGAIALWKRDVLVDLVLHNHNTMFHGEDLQMGIILHTLSKRSKIKVRGMSAESPFLF
jgi:cellulose synthase/poly-beta-1,6-N-acetylglucosamine synthase-like glycosyltransferase